MNDRARWIGTVLLVALLVWSQRDAVLPMPDVVPIPEPGLHVLIISETLQPPPPLAAILNAPAWQSLVPAGNWRVLDPDSDMSRDNAKWRNAMQRPRTSLPWLIVSNYPQAGYEGPLPSSLAELVSIIQRVGGLP